MEPPRPRASIRHSLNEFLEREGGHIGYVVVPEYRRQGHATEILRLALEIAREKCGVDRLLVTCETTMSPQSGTVEKNGGILENVVSGPDLAKPIRRYWIDLSNAGRRG